MKALNNRKIFGLMGLMALSACNGSGDYLRSILDAGDPGAVRGFAHGKVGPDGTPVQRTPYGQAPEAVHSGENYASQTENEWIETAAETTSTFGVDVDNGSYTLMRDDIRAGRLPHPDGVRPEEYINFFDYEYTQPQRDEAFTVDVEAGPSPFGEQKHIVKIGLQARQLDAADLRPTNLVFLIDTSGSMRDARKLPMVKESLYTLLENLRPTDTVGIVTYAGHAGVVLEPTKVRHSSTIRRAIDGLSTGGSTNGEGGIVEAYHLADTARIPGGNNRVILATDGDFNVGRTGESLLDLIREYRAKEITISAIGYGRGNFNDELMEGISREGNGNYFYVDREEEARRIFGRNIASTLQIAATDVKVQVAFEPALVRRYRLIGYENRVMANRDFDDDRKDAGDIGQGHSVTALYEVELQHACADEVEELPPTEASSSSEPSASHSADESDVPWEEAEPTGVNEPVEEAPPCNSSATNTARDAPLATIHLRHKESFNRPSQFREVIFYGSDVTGDFTESSPDFRFATAVAEFAEILRESPQSEGARFDDILAIASSSHAADPARQEFIQLVKEAQVLHGDR